jgi:hypothetical protein
MNILKSICALIVRVGTKVNEVSDGLSKPIQGPRVLPGSKCYYKWIDHDFDCIAFNEDEAMLKLRAYVNNSAN